MTTITDPSLATLGAERWEPFHVDGRRMGSMHWLRVPDADGRGPVAAIWRVLPGEAPDEIPYEFAGDELWHVLEGAIEVVFDDGRHHVLRAGDVAAFPRGPRATFRPHVPFKKLYMVA